MTTMRYSKWQSGTIAPQLSGGYERRDIGGKRDCLIDGVYDANLAAWYCLLNPQPKNTEWDNLIATHYQRDNGHLWQWRGEIRPNPKIKQRLIKARRSGKYKIVMTRVRL